MNTAGHADCMLAAAQAQYNPPHVYAHIVGLLRSLEQLLKDSITS